MAGKAWLAANKMNDDARFLAALHDLWPTAPGTKEQVFASRELFRSLEFKAVGKTGPDSAELWLFDPDQDGYVIATVKVRADDPEKVAGIRVIPTADLPPGVAAQAPLTEPALIAAVRDRAQVAAAAGRFDGAVLIARKGHVLFQHAYGLADRAARKPDTVDTQFRFGSMGKMFTAVAIMQLIEAGKVDPAAPIGRYLPGYANQDIATKVTVANLLTHTGGTGDIFGPEFDSHRAQLGEPADYVALYQNRGPAFEPGSRTAYSNYGFMLLGRIVETVSGQSYDDYIAGHIFKPAGMTATGNLPETVPLPKRATGYMTEGGKIVSADPTLPWSGTPAGGGYSTVGDFARFADALMANRLLDAPHTRLLTEGGFTGADGKFWRYDFGAAGGEGRRYYGHNGGAPGMNGDLRIFPAEPGHDAYTVVVLANRDPPVGSVLANFISDRLP
ncbi:MAG TPA: serine hydrolase domain-containing protein [Caulobacteraceae bacterium]|nr:serine hydrolase domain-containing protein [Caulobacteraceae bacterium]